jgi:hypothetical protein
MNLLMPTVTQAAAALVFAACCWSMPALAHCGVNELCVTDDCHHGPDTETCRQSRGGARAAAQITAPEIRQAVQEIVIPKVPQLNLPVGAPRPASDGKPAAHPANLPAPPGQVDPKMAAAHDTLPFPPGLPPSAIARDVAPQVFAGVLAATRDIDHARALGELAKNDPRLAQSIWLSERRHATLGLAYRQAQRLKAQAAQIESRIGDDPRYGPLSDALSRTSAALELFDGASERK